jgi:hypothetical protein
MIKWPEFDIHIIPGVLDPTDLDNGNYGDNKLPLTEELLDKIKWVTEQLPAGVEWKFFTPKRMGGFDETQIVFAVPTEGEVSFEWHGAVVLNINPSVAVSSIIYSCHLPMWHRINYPGFEIRKANFTEKDPIGSRRFPNNNQEFNFADGVDSAKWAFGDIYTRLLPNGGTERFMRVNFVDSYVGFKTNYVPGWSKRLDPLHARE